MKLVSSKKGSQSQLGAFDLHPVETDADLDSDRSSGGGGNHDAKTENIFLFYELGKGV